MGLILNDPDVACWLSDQVFIPKNSRNEKENAIMAKKLVVYGSLKCSDTLAAQKLLEKENIRYEFVDILSSLESLKMFLNLRDANIDLYADTVANRGIGIPVFEVDGTFFTKDIESLDLNSLR
jgi:glutaredoxin-related protein